MHAIPVSMYMYMYVHDYAVSTLQGIVKTLKDSFGFIERADVVKDVRAERKFADVQSLRFVVLLQIFFHYSELAEAAEGDLIPGTSVEFVIQNRQVLCLYV